MSDGENRRRARVAVKEGFAYLRHGAAMARGDVRSRVASGDHARAFVHGVQANPRVMRSLMAALDDGTPQASFGLGRGTVRQMAATLARDLEARMPDGATLELIGHSLGGLVLRYLVAHEPLGARVRTLITLASPHRGTRVAHALPARMAGDLRPGSSLLRALATSPLPPGVRAIYIAARHDHLVRPHEHALLPGGEHLVLDDIGHNGLLYERRAHEAIRRALL